MKYKRSPLFCKLLTVLIFVIIVIPSAASGFAQDALTQGKRFLLNNQPDKALPLFYKAAAEGMGSPAVSLYVGVCYIRLGKYAEAEQQLLEGKDKDPAHMYLYLFNLGNIYFLQSRFTEAEQAYTAALAARRAYPQAVLNRANTYIKLENYAKALADYTFFLNLEPNASQKEVVQRIISILEQEKQQALDLQRYEHAQRIAKEAEQRAAEQRYKKLQDEINAQLQSVDHASSFSVGSDETLDYLEDYRIE